MLPIYQIKQQIIDTVRDNQVVIISSNTGTGKSSQIPLMLYQELGLKSIITQPRRLACATLTDFVRSSLNPEEKYVVGYKTGFEVDYNESENKILYVTDGLLAAHGLIPFYDVIIIDEIHEWSLNVEVVLAYVKRKLQQLNSAAENRKFKVILMSATLDSKQLELFFLNFNPQVIKLNYEPYPIKTIKKSSKTDIASLITTQARKRNNILCFLPGKKEIDFVFNDIKHLPYEIFILHGDQLIEEQRPAFQHYTKPKIVLCTNICQTSITIDDIDVVIDTGIVKQIQTRQGIKGLYTVNISQSDCLQRKGRAGRTKPGTYILCSDVDINQRQRFTTPEIQRVPLEDTILKLKALNIDIKNMQFIHQPEEINIKHAMMLLQRLDLISSNGIITSLGLKVAKLPLDVRFAIMLEESKKYGFEIFTCVAKICAILQVNGLLRYDKYRGCYQDFTGENKSDLIAELDVFEWIQQKFEDVDWEYAGLNEKHYIKALEYYYKIATEYSYDIASVKSNAIRKDITKCILVAFKDAIFTNPASQNEIKHMSNELCMPNIDFKSCTQNRNGCFVGIPKMMLFSKYNQYYYDYDYDEDDDDYDYDESERRNESENTNYNYYNEENNEENDYYEKYNNKQTTAIRYPLEMDKGLFNRVLFTNVTYISEQIYKEVFGSDSIKYSFNLERKIEDNKTNVYISNFKIYCERYNTIGIFYFEPKTFNLLDSKYQQYKDIIIETWNECHPEDKISFFNIDNLQFTVTSINPNNENIILDDGQDVNESYLSKDCILLTAEDFSYYNLDNIFSNIDHSKYLFKLNINRRLIALGPGFTFHEDDIFDKQFKNLNPIYIISQKLSLIKERLIQEQAKQQLLVDQLIRRKIVVNNNNYYVQCAYTKDHIPVDLTFKDKLINKEEQYFLTNKCNLENITLSNIIYYININIGDLAKLNQQIIYNGQNVLLVRKNAFSYNPDLLKQHFELDIKQYITQKNIAQSRAKAKQLAKIKKIDKSIKINKRIHPVKQKDNKFYIRFSPKALKTTNYDNVVNLFTRGSHQPILFQCGQYSDFNLQKLIEVIKTHDTEIKDN